MGRLIDVADIERFINEKVTVIGDDHLLLAVAGDGRWHEALPLIKTAYDVDKVVEQLEETKAYMLYENMNADVKWIDRAIEIVKAGGNVNE